MSASIYNFNDKKWNKIETMLDWGNLQGSIFE